MPRKLPALAVAVLSLTVTADALGAGYATRTLQVGSNGSDVRALQRYLDGAGYDTTADGAFGPATRRSVVAFEATEERRANGRASRAEQRMVRARAAAAGDGVDEPAAEATEEAYIASWGNRGRGTWVTVRANPGHAYMIVAGLRFDTSAHKQTGTRWSEQMRSARGFRGRHPDGL